jgi:hypothetical protein
VLGDEENTSFDFFKEVFRVIQAKSKSICGSVHLGLFGILEHSQMSKLQITNLYLIFDTSQIL